MIEMVVNEIFHSIQGEGTLAGTPSVFIRLAGCPVGCKWCDTRYAWDTNAGDELAVPEIISRISQWPCRFVVITGGEPMLNPELPDLARALKEQHKHITIETAGIKFVAGLACDLMSISPKLSNSGRNNSGAYISSIKELVKSYPCQLKFVVDSTADLPEIQETLKQIRRVSAEKVMLMPQAKTRDELIAKSPMVAKLCEETGYMFCQRLHILLYDGTRGK